MCAGSMSTLTLLLFSFSQIVLLISLILNSWKPFLHMNNHGKTITLDELSSAVTCFGMSKSTRQCKFTNLCYNTLRDEYLFLHGANSSMFGVPTPRNDPALVDLSGVDDHNAKYFSYTDVPSSYLFNKKYLFVEGNSIIFHRFNPENLMHVFHDDLMTIFYTKSLFYPHSEVNLVMTDRRDEGPYFDLYKLYSNSIYTSINFTDTDFVCFQSALVGLSKQLTWYQYGFKIPQGPLNNTHYPKNDLLYFKNDFLTRMNLSDIPDTKCILLLSRTTSRKILNEAQLLFKLSTFFRLPIYSVSLETDALNNIISLILRASLVISMHGAQLILGIFMKPGAVLAELFPYAVPPENYTPYKTLADLISVRYVAWKNNNPVNNYPHEEREPQLGGLRHLPKELQLLIKNTTTVPPHLCCSDSYWLYRIYQDTVIDVDDLLQHLKQFNLLNQNDHECLSNHTSLFCAIYPSEVTNITCRRDSDRIEIFWDIPWNMITFGETRILYEVFIKDSFNSIVKFLTKETFLVYTISTESLDYSIFIRSIFYKNYGSFSFTGLKC
ncbi:protein O-linked-mannose beta-1,4-N-acetylglucosaminyltransferase 2 [Hydra vulgaris]|uniref:protein O-linked-mannose beta-1,4-N-acetylglucosaminyltransferase 2 n=1 Tax=Hydra vulgaris TaxID=6087 RepID=UPI001F5EF58B|nr:protein O-linked-mannose beta-1,4-N-acetylglucosaminyltransferase 2 [Hydra vulgaris]